MGRPAFLHDERLRHFIDRARIDCENLFDYVCPMYWGALQETNDPAVRHCGQCREDVYFTSTVSELETRAARGQCVAIMLESEVPDPGQVPPEDIEPVMMLGVAVPHLASPANVPRLSRVLSSTNDPE